MKEVLRLILAFAVCGAVMRWSGPVVPLEGQLQERCQRCLEAAVGAGRVHVEVTVETGEVKRDREVTIPGPERVATGCQEKKETCSPKYDQAVSSTKWETSRRHEVLHRTSGIQRISASVVVRDVTPAELPALRQLAEASLGFDAAREDRLSLATVCGGKVVGER